MGNKYLCNQAGLTVSDGGQLRDLQKCVVMFRQLFSRFHITSQ